MSDADYSILSWLVDVGGGELPGHELEQALGFDRSQLSHRLDRMEERDFVNRSLSGGGKVWVRATAGGRAALDAARPAHALAVRRHLLSRLPDSADLASLREVLVHLSTND